ncbi:MULTISPECIES: hypothetical protein [Methylococcus]|uniref:Uncharacterized protein n=1 Tax=Methylococcus capsulatus TaxID=414 RepID=A0ABZ2F5B6_METCP|nr:MULTISPECIES: hypothetical protein [Methylococcus]MDF9390952.1 hypothetical protein [Methylococcus capsulatus]
MACYFGLSTDQALALRDPHNSSLPPSLTRLMRAPTWSAEKPDGRWRGYAYEELVNRDKSNLDIFWLKDASLSDFDNLSAPEVIAQEIVAELEAALEQFRLIGADLGEEDDRLESAFG